MDEYLMMQGRYRHLSPERIADIQAEVDRNRRISLNRVQEGQY